MFISLSQIVRSLRNLEAVHPFFGIGFLVCKKIGLPIGSSMQVAINTEEDEFLRAHYRPDKSSAHYYRVFRVSDKGKHWLRPNYAWTGSQSLRTRAFRDAFIHQSKSDVWGWSANYLGILQRHLYRERKVPAFDLAVWLFRERDWASGTRPEDIVDFFLSEFSITSKEAEALFDITVQEVSGRPDVWQDTQVSWKAIRGDLVSVKPPPDAQPEEGGTLAYLSLAGVGPARHISVRLGERLNLFTGDNGLGKTFLLECAWWALSGQWAGLPAYPRADAKREEPEIAFRIAGDTIVTQSIPYDYLTQSWSSRQARATIPGLLIYARVDGSFAVWDPAKDYWLSEMKVSDDSTMTRPFVFTGEQIWEGLWDIVAGKTRFYCNGLLRDWITWQNNPDRYPFGALTKVIQRLAPADLGDLKPGVPVRLPRDAREIPTLEHAYGTVPILHAAAGVRRIVAMAYLLVWAWEEHTQQSEIIRKEPQRRVVVIVDEVEAHLHPQWQRSIVPALLEAIEILDPALEIQFLIATHSPLVMASVEPVFDPEKDKLFHLDLVPRDLLLKEVELKELPFIRYGRVDSWLMSRVFDLAHARSLEAERAIEDAKEVQLQDSPTTTSIREISSRLVKYLSETDEFWPRWIYFAAQHGVDL